MSKPRRHKLDITLEDVATLSGVTMNVIYSDIKRGRLEKDNLSSVMEYVKTRAKDLPYEHVKGDANGFLL